MANVAFNSPTAAEIRLSSVSGFSQAYTLAAGDSNLCAVARVGWDTEVATVSAITYAGEDMTPVNAKVANPSKDQAQLFTLTNPATGSNTFAVTLSTTVSNLVADIGSFSHVDQTTPVRPGSYAESVGPTDGVGDISITIPSDSDDLTVSIVVIGDVPTTNQTQENANAAGASWVHTDHATASGDPTIHTWNATVGTHGVLAGFSLMSDLAAVAGPSPGPQRSHRLYPSQRIN